MKPSPLLPLILLWFTASLGCAAKPNVLFFFADDQRADTIAALGNGVIKTPNLDRLVKRGVSFDRAFMQGGMHGATCVPSRAMLLSGRSLFRIDEKLMRDETWPAAFGRAGYSTFVSGKWHNGPQSIARSFQTARAMFTGGMTDPMKAPLSDVVDGKVAPAKISPKHACEAFADEAARFLKEPHEAPFFCYVPFDAPHDPHIVPPDFPVQYDPEKIPLPPNFLPQHPWDNGEMTVRDEQLLPWPRKPEAVRAMLAEYYRYISYLDAQIGRVLDALEASPHAKNTIVVFAADSGVARGSHGLIGKQNVYEHSMRVPLIMAGPGIAEGRRTEAMCYLFDVMPTLGRLCAVPGPTTSEGIDFSPVLSDPGKSARTELMFAYRDVQRAVRDDRWKLIRYPKVDRVQLFDLKTDPYEVTNLADKPEHAPKVAELTTLLEKQMTAFGDPAPLRPAKTGPAEWSPPAAPAKAGKSAAGGLPQDRLLLDLDAGAGVEVEDGGRVRRWLNQAPGAAAREFLPQPAGRAEPGSGRPTLRGAVPELGGKSSLIFRQQELVCADEDTFDHLTTGPGHTWAAVIMMDEQRVGLQDVNSFFGNLRNSDKYEGVWGCVKDDNTVWWGARNGVTFGRFDANNPQVTGPKLERGSWHVIVGRMGAGTGTVKLELFVDAPQPVASADFPVSEKANPSRMAVGQERDATQHPGVESFDGEIARLLIWERALGDPELAGVMKSLAPKRR